MNCCWMLEVDFVDYLNFKTNNPSETYYTSVIQSSKAASYYHFVKVPTPFDLYTQQLWSVHQELANQEEKNGKEYNQIMFHGKLKTIFSTMFSDGICIAGLV